MKVHLITDDDQLKQAFAIREEVFVKEQKVAYEEEFDEFEDSCRHFLATSQTQPSGAARWRYTSKGVKLERFAVLTEFRRQGVASALIQAVLDDITAQSSDSTQMLYLHAQVEAVPLYEKFGFQISGNMFMECDIAHYLMIK